VGAFVVSYTWPSLLVNLSCCQIASLTLVWESGLLAGLQAKLCSLEPVGVDVEI